MRDDSEYKFLNGPRSRTQEFVFTVKILFEFIRGLRAFHFLGPCVTVFGSARYKSDHHLGTMDCCSYRRFHVPERHGLH